MYNTQQAGGYWSAPDNEKAATGAAAFAFLSQQDKWGDNAAIYQAAVEKAMGYLLKSATVSDVSPGNDGLNICPGAAGSCKGVYWSNNAESIYATAMAAPAIAAYGLIMGRDAVATPSGPLAGMTWGEIAQGITNAIAAYRSDNGSGQSGWPYFIPTSGAPDSSNVQLVLTALLYNEALGAITPEAIRNELKSWLNRVQNGSVPACYRLGAEPCGPADMAAMLLAMKLTGYDLANSQLQSALAFLNQHWQGTGGESKATFGRPAAMWAIYTGLEAAIGLTDAARIVNLLTDCGGSTNEAPGDASGAVTCTWSEDYNHWLVKHQKVDGSWDGTSYVADPIATAFYIDILGGNRVPVAPYSCPAGRAFWTSAPQTWPVSVLGVGGQIYTKRELLTVLSASGMTGAVEDASITLAAELITARLNLARGADRAPVLSAIVKADQLLRAFDGKLPYRIASSSLTREKMIVAARMLEAYNNGGATAGCGAADDLSNSERPERQTATAQIQPARALASADRTSSAVPMSSAQLAQTPRPPVNLNVVRPFVRKGVTALAIKPDGSALATAGTDNKIRMWSPLTGRQTLVFPDSAGFPAGVVFSPDGALLSSIGRDSVVRIWNAATGSLLANLNGHAQSIRAIAVSPNGKYLATAGEDSRILLWDLASRKLSKILYGSRDFVNALSFSPDSRLLASGGEDARVIIFDVAAGKSLYTLLGHSGPVDAVAFSPDGTTLASAGQDTVIHLWNPATGRQRYALRGHAAPVETIAFSSDGKSLASGGQDAQILVWNVATGALLKMLVGSSGAINVLLFGPGPLGGFLASATDAGKITLWNVATGIQLLTITAPTAP